MSNRHRTLRDWIFEAVLARRAAGLLVLSFFAWATYAGAAIIETSTRASPGDPLEVAVTIDDESDPGNLVFTLSVDDSRRIQDLRRFFANVTDEGLLPGLSVSGEHVVSSQFRANGVIDLRGGSPLDGGGSPCPCDLGITLESPGPGRSDDYRSITFILSHESIDLDISLFQNLQFGVRVTSRDAFYVSDEGSTRVIRVVPEPTMALSLGLGLLLLARRRLRPSTGKT